MRFAYDAEQQELGNVTRQFLTTKCGLDDVRRDMDTPSGHDPRLWAELAQLGLVGLAVPDQFGGSAASLIEVAVVLREAGRALLTAPLLATTIASCALMDCADDATARYWLPRIAAGQAIAAVAAEPLGGLGMRTPLPAARRVGADWALTGDTGFVLSGLAADLIVLTAGVSDAAEGDIGLFAVSADAPGLTRTALPTLDPTRSFSAVTLADTPAKPVSIGRDRVQHLLDLAAVLLAAEQVGGAERCLQSATDYAKLRVQFENPIGSFQAIKHLLADVLVEVESAKAAADYAAWAAARAPTELALAAALAKAFCSDTYVQAAKVNFQVHGGIAFTWEHDAHLHLKRAVVGKQLFGSPEFHRERVAQAVLAISDV